MYDTSFFASFITLATKASLSRDAVPLPIAMISMLYLLIKSRTFFLEVSKSFFGSCGNITSICSKVPVEDMTASLQPVRKAGSKPNTVLLLIGGCINKL